MNTDLLLDWWVAWFSRNWM